MDRKQQNLSLCRTDTGGHTIHGCHSCDAKLNELIDVTTETSRFRLCSPESYHWSKSKFHSRSEHSQNRGYNTSDYNAMMYTGIVNFHYASPVDFYHCLMNIMEQFDEAIKCNILQTEADKHLYSKYISILSNERDKYNSLKYPDDLHTDKYLYNDIRLDQAFNVSVCLIFCYYLLIGM